MFRLEHTAGDGNLLGQLYNLDAIIAVGYRVNSYQAQFRIWATNAARIHHQRLCAG